jgi:hypothetical protein
VVATGERGGPRPPWEVANRRLGTGRFVVGLPRRFRPGPAQRFAAPARRTSARLVRPAPRRLEPHLRHRCPVVVEVAQDESDPAGPDRRRSASRVIDGVVTQTISRPPRPATASPGHTPVPGGARGVNRRRPQGRPSHLKRKCRAADTSGEITRYRHRAKAYPRERVARWFSSNSAVRDSSRGARDRCLWWRTVVSTCASRRSSNRVATGRRGQRSGAAPCPMGASSTSPGRSPRSRIEATS